MLVGFSGRSYAGKTTAAKHVSEAFGYKHVSLADNLKLIARGIFPFTDDELYGRKRDIPYKEFAWTPRQFLVNLGGLIRYHDPLYLIRPVLKEKGDVTIDDVRFKAEAEAIREKGGKIIRIERYEKYLNKNAKGESETELDDYKFDRVINPVENLTMKTLYQTLDAVFEELGLD